MKRRDGREFDQLRNIRVERDFIKYAEGSCLIEMGDTRVVCTASVDNSVPPFLRGSGQGWVTAEYGMLPRSTNNRIARDRISGRSMEIQRLIGRALRSAVDLKRLGDRTLWIDCDVIQADGGTRTASVTGGFIALVDCIFKLYRQKEIPEMCIDSLLGAVSVGSWQEDKILDLTFLEDSGADTDMNVAMKSNGEFIEIQGTAEKKSFTRQDLDSFLDLARKGIEEILEIERSLFKEILPKL